MTSGGSGRARRAAVAVIPSMTGIRMSIRTTSGRCRTTGAAASAPSPTSAITSMSEPADMIMPSPALTRASSSTSRTRIIAVALKQTGRCAEVRRGPRNLRRHRDRGRRCRRVVRPARRVRSGRRRIRWRPIVRSEGSDCARSRSGIHRPARPVRPSPEPGGVFRRVGQRLLHDPERVPALAFFVESQHVVVRFDALAMCCWSRPNTRWSTPTPPRSA